MPKLADLIQRATRAEPPPIGFASQRGKPPPTIVLVATVGRDWKKRVAEAFAAGADACLFTNRPGRNDIADAIAASDGRACGLADGAGAARELRDAGLDFVVLDTDAPASVLQDDDLSIVLRVPADLSDIQLRTMETLSVDAIYLDQAAQDTILGQMELRRVSGLSRRGLLVPAPPEPSQDGLLSLRDAGVALLAVDADRDTDAIQRLRQLIDDLPRRRRRRHDARAEVSLAFPTAAAQPEGEDDED